MVQFDDDDKHLDNKGLQYIKDQAHQYYIEMNPKPLPEPLFVVYCYIKAIKGYLKSKGLDIVDGKIEKSDEEN